MYDVMFAGEEELMGEVMGRRSSILASPCSSS
jgi:hypothetical protein